MSANWQTVTEIDLTSLKSKLKDQKGVFWRMRYNVDALEKEYRQFLYLILMNPGQVVVPWTQQLDDFWHCHILDTAKYEKDCMKLFGKILHHDPHLPQGSRKQTEAFQNTKKMYKDTFKEKSKSSDSGSACGAGCGGGFIAVFCGGCSDHSSSSSAVSCSSASSGSSCSGGSSCGGED